MAITISGSVGKTTTRRLLASALGSRMKTLEPMRNFNNLIGLPATLTRLRPDHQIAVLELGMNQRGELKRLTEIASPDVAGLTRIGRAHMGMFGSIAELIEAKLELFEGARPGAPLVVNAACQNTMGSIARFEADHPIVRFSATPRAQAEVKVENVQPIAPIGYRFDLSWPGGKLEGLRLVHFGRHALEDVAAAAALLLAAGREIDLIVDAVGAFATEPLRGQVIEAGPWTFIMDCYNAAPESMRGAIEALGELAAAGRTILVLADMAELGEGSRAEHEALAAPIGALAPAAFFGLGDEMNRLAEGLAAGGMTARGASDRDELTERLGAFLLPGDRVYFKGARRFALEEVARSLAPQAPIMSEATVLTPPAAGAGNVDFK